MSTTSAQGSLSQWLATPLGAHILQVEQSYFDQELADVFGFHALQLGLPEHDFLRANRMPFRARTAVTGPSAFLSDPCALPVQTGVIDLVVVPHVLEFSSNPHQVLREVARILMPEGHVVVSGFNPWSLWGVRRLAARDAAFPWCGQFINLPRLKDWMALLGFEVAAGRMACYVPPLASEKWRQRFGFMEKAGDRWWPFAGGVYFLHAIKRVHGMRLITPKWKAAGEKRKALAPIPHRHSHPDDARAARHNGVAGDSR
ncbi:MAG TPA: methyltransferase domain-containing protein [Burkholderiales bacterium]|jgi:SAM-dependent methyltransferase|nr:methyltransferase domain-containing protein [Burkholderiales bacterium]